MRRLKHRTIVGKLKGLVGVLRTYVKAYCYYHGWSVYVMKDGAFCQRIGRDRFRADPFLFEYKGDLYLFYESVDRNEKGHICCSMMMGSAWKDFGCVLSESFHMSYPQVFEYDGSIFMIPETSEVGMVYLYKAIDFPVKWERVQKLIEAPFADSTVIHYEGLWYMVCYKIPPKPTAELWMSRSLYGPWSRHPCYTAVNQSRRLKRCGGSFMYEQGRLYRVAQDGNGMYGKRLFKIPIEELSPDSYKEGIASLLMDKAVNPAGYKHTYNRIAFRGSLFEVVDLYTDFALSPVEIYKNISKAILKKLHKLK